MRFLLVLLLTVSITPAFAQNVDLKIDCSRIADDADYEPGVDVNGNPVAPADVEGGQGSELLQYPVEIPIDVDLLHLLNIDLAEIPEGESALEAETRLITVTLHKDGHVEYDGKDVSDKVAVECMTNPEKPSEILPSTLQQAKEAGISVDLRDQSNDQQDLQDDPTSGQSE